MRKYKKWSPEERRKSLGYTNEAKKRGWIKQPSKCNRCGQKEGILHLHNDDYDWTLDVLPLYLDGTKELDDKGREDIATCCEEICWTCHMIHHSEHRNKDAHKKYFDKVKTGWISPPVYKHDFSVLRKYGF